MSGSNAPTAEIDLKAPLHERIELARQAYLQDRSQMTLLLARKFGLPEAEVIRVLPAEQVTELDASQWEPIIRSFEQIGSVHVIASNASVTLECFGEFGKFSVWGDFFNVQTKSLDMHIRSRTLAYIFAIEKPGHMDGVSTLSFQFFNQQGEAAFKVFLTFGNQPASPEKRAQWEAIRDQYKKA